MVWGIVLGQTLVGLTVTWLIIQPLYGVPDSFGMLIETGFAGGHGTAAAMGQVLIHPAINLTGATDLGILVATVGLLYGLVSGVFWVNLGVRKGWLSTRAAARNHHCPEMSRQRLMKLTLLVAAFFLQVFSCLRHWRSVGFFTVGRSTWVLGRIHFFRVLMWKVAMWRALLVRK